MAARENQGMFIAVILLVLLSVVLAVATFFGFSSYREAKDQKDTLETQLAEERKASQGNQALAGMLQAYGGYGDLTLSEAAEDQAEIANAGLADLSSLASSITASYEADMAKHPDPEGGNNTYRGLVGSLAAAVDQMHNDKTVLNATIDSDELKFVTELAAKQKTIDEQTTQLTNARNDLKAQQDRNSELESQHRIELANVQTQFNQTRQALQEEQDNRQTQVANLESERDALQNAVVKKEATITQLTALETDVADGQIISIAPADGKVVLNIGSADNLRLNQSFAIYDQDVRIYRSGKEKASVRVTRILGPRKAEARITSQRITDPILVNDFVSTPTWDRGYSVPIAIAASVHLDNDGSSDLQRLISIVEANGFGNVVAYHDEQGKVFGKIDENTRLFVMGDESLLRAARTGFDTLDAQRERFQPRVISIRELLVEMGYISEARFQRFEPSNNRGQLDFIDRQPQGTSVDTGSPFEGSGSREGSSGR